MTRYLVDTNVFLYARGGQHPYREPCRSVLRAAAGGSITLAASVEVVQEFAHVLLRRGIDRGVVLEEVDEVRSQCQVHPFDVEVLHGACGLLRSNHRLGVRDAVHAATAIRLGLPAIVSTDRVFDTLSELRRLDPGRGSWLARAASPKWAGPKR